MLHNKCYTPECSQSMFFSYYCRSCATLSCSVVILRVSLRLRQEPRGSGKGLQWTGLRSSEPLRTTGRKKNRRCQMEDGCGTPTIDVKLGTEFSSIFMIGVVTLWYFPADKHEDGTPQHHFPRSEACCPYTFLVSVGPQDSQALCECPSGPASLPPHKEIRPRKQ